MSEPNRRRTSPTTRPERRGVIQPAAHRVANNQTRGQPALGRLRLEASRLSDEP